MLFICQDTLQENYARVATYVNKQLLKMRFTLCLDIVNHWDINVLAFHNNHDMNFIINVYSDSDQTAWRFLSQNIINLDNTIIMTGDFNIRDSNWDPNYHHYFIHTEDLITIADSLGLELSPPLNPGPTRFVDNPCNSNSVIDFVFLPPNNKGFSQHKLYSDIHKPLDHIPLVIEVGIADIDIDHSIRLISKDNQEEKDFVTSLTKKVSNLNSSDIKTKEDLESLVQQLAYMFENAWNRHFKLKRITKYSKE